MPQTFFCYDHRSINWSSIFLFSWFSDVWWAATSVSSIHWVGEHLLWWMEVISTLLLISNSTVNMSISSSSRGELSCFSRLAHIFHLQSFPLWTEKFFSLLLINNPWCGEEITHSIWRWLSERQIPAIALSCHLPSRPVKWYHAEVY